MQAYLLSGLGSPTSCFNLFLPMPRPRVSNHYHTSSVHYHYNNIQSKLKLHYRPRPSSGWCRNGVIFASASASAAATTDRDHQNHYAVLGISATASSTEIKSAYRRLAKKYHPDICKDSKSGEVFKSIRLAYDVLSNEVTRAQYDFQLTSQADPRRQSEKYRQQDKADKKSKVYKRVSFRDVKISALFALFSMLNVSWLTLFSFRLSSLYIFSFSFSSLYLISRSLFALSDMGLNGGYKMGYLFAWFLGGRKGVLLTLCLTIESWAFGKRRGSDVTQFVVAMWAVTNLAKIGINLMMWVVTNLAKIGINLARVGISLARYASSSIPQVALIALLYMAIKLQVYLK